MKRKAFQVLIAFVLLAIASTFIFNLYIMRKVNSNEKDKAARERAIRINDVIKNAQYFLEGSNESKIENTLEQYGYDLILVGDTGKIEFDSSNKNSISKIQDVNMLLQKANEDKFIFCVNPNPAMGKGIYTAIIDTHEKPDDIKDGIVGFTWLLCTGFVILAVLVFLLIYINVIIPFLRLEQFAGEVAKGNLEIPLAHWKHNLFGAFTWAFDMLRAELKASKEREFEAEKSKKEMVAVLSHDLRTPIASIKAYAECLKSLQEKDSERGQKYIDVIISKTDEITKLSQDMFLHAISDLEKLEIIPGEYQSRELLNSIIEPLMLHYENRIIITSAFPDVKIYTDKVRLLQVFENIISNSAKYSPKSVIEISSMVSEEGLKCIIRDFGEGVPPEDLPFLFDKFFRGKNAKESGLPGSGLGLYISKYILEKTSGNIKGFNFNAEGKSGFAVEISIRIV